MIKIQRILSKLVARASMNLSSWKELARKRCDKFFAKRNAPETSVI